jgi:hypothetical protein
MTHGIDWCEVGMVQDLTEMVGALLLVRVTYVDRSGDNERSIEFAGRVSAVSPLVSIEVEGDEPFTLPPDPDAYSRADPGEYTLATTGEVVLDPDFTTVWTVNSPT